MAKANQNTLKLVVVGLAGVMTIVALVALGTHRGGASNDAADAGAEASAAAAASADAALDAAAANANSGDANADAPSAPATPEDAASATAADAAGESTADAASDGAIASHDAGAVDAGVLAATEAAQPAPEMLELARRAFEGEAPRLYLGNGYVVTKRTKIGDLRVTKGAIVVAGCMADANGALPNIAVKNGTYPVELVTAKDVGGLLTRIVVAPGKPEKVFPVTPASIRSAQGIACFAEAGLFPIDLARREAITQAVSVTNFHMASMDNQTTGNVIAFDTKHEERTVSVYRAVDARDQLLSIVVRMSEVEMAAPAPAHR